LEISIIKIGYSKGFRLSKTILERYKIKEKMKMILEKGQIILLPVADPRKDWDKAFQKMNEQNDDLLLIVDVFEDENLEKEEWH
jgi:antitoxin MazE